MNNFGNVVGINWQENDETGSSVLTIRGLDRAEAAWIIGRVVSEGRVSPLETPRATAVSIVSIEPSAASTPLPVEVAPVQVFAAEVVKAPSVPAPAMVVDPALAKLPTIEDVAMALESAIHAPVRIETVRGWTEQERAAVMRWTRDPNGDAPVCVQALLPREERSTSPDPWGLSTAGEDLEDVVESVAAEPAQKTYDINKIKAATRVGDIVTHLWECGYKTKDAIVAECSALKANVAVLSRVPDMDKRITGTMQTLSLPV